MDFEEFMRDDVLSCFFNICNIPHGSGNEAQLSEYLRISAEKLGYEVITDSAYNVLIKAPACSGYEDKPAVMLQAHMDMVCEKLPGYPHDFDCDPIPLVIDGDMLTTGGKVTMGADNGIGLALAMALISDKAFKHPPLEILFTTNEEEDFSGVAVFDMGLSESRLLLNLDHVKEGEIICGSCGGMRVDMTFPLEMKALSDGDMLYKIKIGGLKGGHSGDDVHRGRGSANTMMSRLMKMLGERLDYKLVSVKGGSFRLAIPRDAEFTLAAPKAAAEQIRAVLSDAENTFRRELAVSGKDVQIDFEPLCGAEQPSDAAEPMKVITAISLCPDGIYQMNEAFEGIVDTSCNLGEIYLEGDRLSFVLEIRSAAESLREELFSKMKALASLLGGTAECADKYPSWAFRSGSPLQTLCVDVYKKQSGKDMRFMTVHAGLEVGYLLEKRPELDAVSLGPDIRDFHSPSESVSISSVKRVYEYLKALLSAM